MVCGGAPWFYGDYIQSNLWMGISQGNISMYFTRSAFDAVMIKMLHKVDLGGGTVYIM